MNLEQQREQLRLSYRGSDDQSSWLYEDYKLLVKHGKIMDITEDHRQAVIYLNRKVCLPQEGLF